MKAVAWTDYGPPHVLELREIPKPTPKADEILIQVYATTVTAGDCELRSLSFPFYLNLVMRLWQGLLKPRDGTIPGTEFAGRVEAVGPEVTRFSVGDRVFGASGADLGTNAEYVCLPEGARDMGGVVSTMPTNMNFAEAVTVPFGGRDALHFLTKANLQRGEEILINGAGGSIGTYAVQLAVLMGARVTAVDSVDKLDMLRSLGAERVMDYAVVDFSKTGETYDVVLDVVGKSRFWPSLRSLKPKGRYVQANPRLRHMFMAPLARVLTGRKVFLTPSTGSADALITLKDLVEQGKLRAFIDRTFALDQIVEAHRYVESGRKRGHVVITVVDGSGDCSDNALATAK